MQSARNIIPPYILHRIINNGSDEERRCAQQTLMHVQSLMVAPVIHPDDHEEHPAGKIQRNIYDAEHQQTLPGKRVRTEGQPGNGDITVDEAYTYLGITYDFFWKIFGRNSLDNKGLPLIGSVHYGKDYQNAFWNGQQMVFGDGDGKIFNRFTIALDVIAHELSHGVVESESNLLYFRQSGALNESLADVFGSMVKQYYRNQKVQQADWIIGEGLLADGIDGKGLRSMARPGTAYDDLLLGTDPQPAHMRDFVNTREDNGGVHLNSGIPNRAFYLAAMALGGYSWEKTGRIWYDALCDKALPQNADFSIFARFTVEHAKKRFNEAVADAVLRAWHQVGVDTGILNEHEQE
ncbi:MULTISPECIES: M4 family metallopeptidase [Dickeya]|uniref:Neutral metalloproteinase n=1 Tax=Dickeya fangzhongdai TaxID=1778540 RepID=A0A2K8QQR2_9GAMM|nr:MULTISPECIES: M4 family metallopeptidase [Dickeya]ATZ95398.1 peptidase M4 family protein [Dickeya fangzhongdai]AYH49052.1 peptidase M4 family protein [Dickeya fangzhongdai]QOH48840.1 peptidase M4 family protein [Dickeya fangzhongdai]QOH53144.1 peptidase M4 family protein [Dickeya fangzhongdai]WOX99651.1 M4 family metallopeptidase [Dickeya fangzhongdai]